MLAILLIDGEIQNVRDAAVGEQACKAAEVFVGDAGEIAGEGFKPVRSDDRTLGEIIRKRPA